MSDEATKNPFQAARSYIIDSIHSEFVGPLIENDLLTENPVTRYAAGMLFPVNYEGRNDSPPTQDQKLDGENDLASATGDFDIEDSSTGLANSFFPSVLGISFYCLGKDPVLNVRTEWTTYSKIDPKESYVYINELPESILQIEEFKSNFKIKDGKLFITAEDIYFDVAKIISEKSGDEKIKSILEVAIARFRSGSVWTNTKASRTIAIDPSFKWQKIAEGLELICDRKPSEDGQLTLYTIAIKNTQPACSNGMDEEHVLFNVSVSVTTGEEQDLFSEYSSSPLFNSDNEEQSLALLYRNRKTYAVGHGCAANWERRKDSQNAYKVFTKSLPFYEVPQSDFDIPGLDTKTLSMQFLSSEGAVNSRQIVDKLSEFCTLYKTWIEDLSKTTLTKDFSEVAARHIGLCNEIHSRMTEGITILAKNNTAMDAFKLANKSMLMQSLHSTLQKEKRVSDGNPVNFPDYNSELAGERKWRPFQLGFLLLSIKGIIDPASDDRKIVDLIWFPTGGGKTEAYLGLSAFTVFYRRLNHLGQHAGTAIMMRYTLRLLTAQQFQRACTLICAMEKLRRQAPEKLGDDEISIGLWVGVDSTPNTMDQAKQSFDEFITGTSDKNPSPLLSCPWCGTKMLIEEGRGRRSYAYKTKVKSKTSPTRATLFCFERSCEFNDRLPILIVDEEVYETPPTLLFGTVDKFALMPLQKGVSKLFSANPENKNLPPELIIQDELHLISGALGTLVGIYETAIDYLCSRKGIQPKIIASTATVRRAAEQCRNLFNRETRQFPAPGIDISDSFFSKETPLEKKPGRLYVGLMPSGKTQTTASIRLSASLLHTVATMPFDDNIKDKYWTLVSYFNSIRELGGFISLLYDDIPLYANALKQRYGGMMRHIAIEKELTSRKSAEEIPEILEDLSVGYPTRGTIDVLSATNMLSVGVDIDRLGLMVIRGQPKLTSEYIQVSSRIGRKFPGLVVTLYNSARTRDRAHYERFRTYHESFYRNVEPSSVTPFSRPARARALSAILVTLFRHGLANSEYNGEEGASLFKPDLPGIKELQEYIFNRVKSIDSEEAQSTMVDFKKLLQDWMIFIESNNGKVVYRNDKQGIPVVRRSDNAGGGLWMLPTSMRNVDAECNIDIKDE
ncbi:hypothetical protein A3A70_02885 [candidate division WWE3 bacterium RIFCSPLOWO2_01_FULL_42_11]|uniref:Helicase C-terminal domain-containing protein n=1 Tax=candidate division WWE3 bacterium RIFCSPLOWO2_01_FULL_42_11 TaxID=1802627 RepID=A0A1F4VRW1_UNCKA|nr:MAG: hypothetical protein A3A70_02885 [candidate division WWE3 bacterium RIFCSPLOWO2_01_FULL_42_11]